MKRKKPSLTLLAVSILALTGTSRGFGAPSLYDNTAIDTLNTLFYSVGAYNGIGDQVRLVAAAGAASARLQFFNQGDPGTFDVELRLYEIGAPVGPQFATFTETGVVSAGMDIIDVEFSLGGLAVPQDLVFMASVQANAGMDLGLNLFEPPAVGSSDNTFLLIDTGTVAQAFSSNENLYFQITAVPEPSTIFLLGMGLAAGILYRRRKPTSGNRAARELTDSW